MRPVPIPDECVPPGCKRFVIMPPDGDMTSDKCRPVEAVAGMLESGVGISVLVAFDEGDVERIAECGAFWLTMYTPQIPPFAVEIADGRG